MHAVIVIVNAFRALKSVARQSSLEMHAQSQCLLARSCAHNEINLPEGNDKARHMRVKAPTAVFHPASSKQNAKYVFTLAN